MQMEELIEKHGKGKVFGIIYAILAASLILFMILVANSYYTLRYDGIRFRLREVSDSRVVLVDGSGNFMIMNLTNSSHRGGTGEITYLDKVISFSARRQIRATQLTGSFTFSDGSELRAETAQFGNHINYFCTEPRYIEGEGSGIDMSWMIETALGIDLSFLEEVESNTPPPRLRLPTTPIERTNLQVAEMRLIGNLLSYHQPEITYGFRVGMTFLGLFVLLIGLGGIMYPAETFRLQHYFSVREVELSEFGLAMSKFGGVLCIIMVFIFPLIMFFIA